MRNTGMQEVDMTQQEYAAIIEAELVPAFGCTEPIAIALAAAKAREVLGTFPESMELYCSGNVVKNVKGVTVPNSGGLKGIDVAGVLGAVCGRADRDLEVLADASKEDVEKTKELLNQEGFVTCRLQPQVDNLYVRAVVKAGDQSAEVTISGHHTFISEIKKDGEVLLSREEKSDSPVTELKKKLTLKGIYDYVNEADLTLVQPLLERQITYNERIAREGLTGRYGARVGQTLLDSEGATISVRARALAAAGSDARMSGCALPVVINSGSGNQGLTVSLPILTYARELQVPDEVLYRALLMGNLTSIHQKSYIGNLSAFCGAVSAAAGAGAGITYLFGGSFEQIASTVINSLANASGIVCDGAKASCAAKIASAVEAAILAHNMSMRGVTFHSGDGLILDNVEKTMQSIGYVGRVGMEQTDRDILEIMLGNINFSC